MNAGYRTKYFNLKKQANMHHRVKRLLMMVRKPLHYIDKKFDKDYKVVEVSDPKIVTHLNILPYLYEIGNKKGMRILEIGSREVTGQSKVRENLSNAEYVGFDFYAGNNVDIVGDAHKISSYFKEGEQFDIIYSSACFEHFAMPWVVATEITKLLKVGGIVIIETHFSFSAHERPWNFFQFSDMGLRALFSPALGYECLDAGMSNSIIGRFSNEADEYLRDIPVRGLYCHSSYLGKKVRDVQNFDWSQVNLTDVVGETKYPEPKNVNHSH